MTECGKCVSVSLPKVVENVVAAVLLFVYQGFLLFQQFTHRIDLARIGKSKIPVVQYHPFGTLFQRKVLYLRKESLFISKDPNV